MIADIKRLAQGIFLRYVRARQRLLASAIVGTIAWLAMAGRVAFPIREIIAWDIGAICYLTLAWVHMLRAGCNEVRARAKLEDNARFVFLAVIVGAAAASFVAIAYALKDTKELAGLSLVLHLALAAVTIAASWLITHTIFALHYAHEFYGDRPGSSERKIRGGLKVPGTEMPDYGDFLYFSFVIGMTCQVSDIAIEAGPIRRLALAHGILSFFFNTVILALAINIVAGVI